MYEVCFYVESSELFSLVYPERIPSGQGGWGVGECCYVNPCKSTENVVIVIVFFCLILFIVIVFICCSKIKVAICNH